MPKRPPRALPRGPHEAKIVDSPEVFDRCGGSRLFFRLPDTPRRPKRSPGSPLDSQGASKR
eukprot:5960109-Pyramimonas_sp.AAC.1